MKLTIFFLFIFTHLLFAQGFIIDHTCTNVELIPESFIEQVQDELKVHYAHTSHGEQLPMGFSSLVVDYPYLTYAHDMMNLPNTTDALCIFDGQETETYISPDLYWETAAGRDLTRDVLDNNLTINISQWAWCTQLEYYSLAQVQQYLAVMETFETEYPDVTFIYMTGNAQATGAEGYQRYVNNEYIRNYCQTNNKILFDFADIDAWYNGEMNYYMYNDIMIPREHSAFFGDVWGHTNELSCRQKGSAWWWLFARLVGWEGYEAPTTYEVAPESISLGEVYIGNSAEGSFAITNISGSAITLDSITSNHADFAIEYASKLSGCSLNSGESVTIDVTFSPSTVGNIMATITIASETEGDLFVYAYGEGANEPGGDFHVSGDVSGIWSYGNIYVDGDITVPNGQTLQINPASGGTDIILTGDYQFIVRGRLLALGTRNDSLRFYPQNTETGWGGMRIYDLNYGGMDSTLVSYTKFSYGNADGADMDGFGGAIIIYESNDVRIAHSVFENCTAIDGGGAVHIRYSNPILQWNHFFDNSAVYGGALHCRSSYPNISNSIFADNSASYGGAVFTESSDPQFEFCTFYGNNSTVQGNCMDLINYSWPSAQNSIFWQHGLDVIHIQTEGGAIIMDYCNIEGGWSSGTGNINANPLFENAAQRNFRLSWNNFPANDATKSPCIDSGNPLVTDADETRCDMGAYFFNQTMPAVPGGISIQISSGNIVLEWDEVPEATCYSVYSSENPVLPLSSWTHEATVYSNSWSEQIPLNQTFYFVTSDNEPLK
jgi:hypothetical protein